MTRSRLITLTIFLVFLGWFAWGIYASSRQAGLDKQLAAAVDRFDVPAVKHLLAAGVDPNTRKDGTPSPTWRERWQDLFGHVPRRRQYLGVPVLVVAAAGPDMDSHPFPKNEHPDSEIVRMLLAKGADINSQSDVPDTYGSSADRLVAKSTALVEACRDNDFLGTSRAVTPTVQILLDAGADVRSADDVGDTALHYACMGRCRPALIQRLLDRGADVNASDQKGDTPLMEIMDNPEAVRLLLSHGADPNASDREGSTPLIDAALDQSTDDFRILLSHGAHVNARDKEGQTALFYTGDIEIARLLIAHGAEVNLRNRSGDTPLKSLHRYTTDPKNFPDLVQKAKTVEIFLIKHGGKV